ncbi:MAG: hypothetical protein AB7I42_23090 [Bradyrhizobium sp.]|uniref:hypothetical protein n=1 Tax=Bradyrhizobium sp. TaxID=376 RepID=UPI003D0DC6C1
MDSVRQRLIANRVEMIRAAALVKQVDDAEPWDYLRGPLPRAWVIEGVEEFDLTALESKTDCMLTVIVQIAFPFKSADPQQTLYRKGRDYVARLERAWMADYGCGGLAKISVPVGNSIGQAADQDKSIGVLTTEWRIEYLRSNLNPYER